jgi:hypothetical protein
MLGSITTSAFAIHKCIVNGNTTYTDLPCPPDATTERFTQSIPPQPDPAAAKARHQANLKQLDQIDKARAQERKQQQQLDQQRLKQSQHEQKELELHVLRCKRLEIQLQLARKRLLAPSSNRLEIDKIKEKDLADHYRSQCK